MTIDNSLPTLTDEERISMQKKLKVLSIAILPLAFIIFFGYMAILNKVFTKPSKFAIPTLIVTSAITLIIIIYYMTELKRKIDKSPSK